MSMTSSIIDLFVGSLSLKNIDVVNIKSVVFWGSNVGSIASSISGLSDVENIKNTIAKEISYVESDNLALLYTLLVRTTVHDLSSLLELYGEKTCFIGHNPSLYVCNRCVIVCFANEASKLIVIGSTSVFKGVNLCWAGFSLACCTKCKHFGHIFDVCLAGGNSGGYDTTVANTAIFFSKFAVSVKFSDLNAMWDVVYKTMTLLANEIFKKKWSKDYNKIFTKELLVFRLVKTSHLVSSGDFVVLLNA
ncbi:hypothetical protein G9A89_017647 [Geosiphon pyriformis]|nr:hypothetical protein G9A89_017647 [Geosiphon pyriformis]